MYAMFHDGGHSAEIISRQSIHVYISQIDDIIAISWCLRVMISERIIGLNYFKEKKVLLSIDIQKNIIDMVQLTLSLIC